MTRRPARIAPPIPALRPPMPAGPSALAIQAQTIDELLAEIARLNASGTVRPALDFEAKMYAELMGTRLLYHKEIREKHKWKQRAVQAEARLKLLEDRLRAMQLVEQHKEKEA